jgi:hypothetical protein
MGATADSWRATVLSLPAKSCPEAPKKKPGLSMMKRHRTASFRCLHQTHFVAPEVNRKPNPISMKLMIITLSSLLAVACFASAGEKMSDAEIKQKLLGYWSSPRHGYHIAADGIIYMCPRKYATTTNHWNVKDGKFYWSTQPIVGKASRRRPTARKRAIIVVA